MPTTIYTADNWIDKQANFEQTPIEKVIQL